MSRTLLIFSSLAATTRISLTRAGYESLEELSNAFAEELSDETGLSLSECEELISASQTNGTVINKSAVSVTSKSIVLTCNYSSVNAVLGGGLPKGSVLEISGPPGCFKEKLAVDFVKKFIEAGEEVIFVDMQNMMTPWNLQRMLQESPTTPANYMTLIRYTQLYTLPELIAFMHTLHSNLTANTGLVVLNSISFPFQSAVDLEHSQRKAILQKLRQILLETSESGKVTTVITSQLATKLLDADGAPANFETGTTAIMVPQLGPAYLPASRSYRLIIAYESLTTGFVRLLSSPGYRSDDGPPPQESYVL